GDEQVVVTVVVVVAHRHTHSVHLDVEASLVGHIGECSVVIVVIELRRRMSLHVPGPVHPVHKENVRPPIVVVVDESNARTERFWQVLFAEGSSVMREANPSPCRHVAERDRRCLWYGRRQGSQGRCRSDSKYNCQPTYRERPSRFRHCATAIGSRPTPSASATLLM